MTAVSYFPPSAFYARINFRRHNPVWYKNKVKVAIATKKQELQLFQICQPQRPAGIAWHSPVASWGEGNAADFRSIRQAGTLELLREKPSIKTAKPFQDDSSFLFSAQCFLCQMINFRRCQSNLIWNRIKVAIATKKHNYSCSKSASHSVRQASLGIRQSPLGERVTLPTFGASGRQERLNCWEKNRR